MKYALEFTENFTADSRKIKKSGDKSLIKKLESLLLEIAEDPKFGTGKPEQLRHLDTPTWSAEFLTSTVWCMKSTKKK